MGERGLKLSGGEKQRVALARAFLKVCCSNYRIAWMQLHTQIQQMHITFAVSISWPFDLLLQASAVSPPSASKSSQQVPVSSETSKHHQNLSAFVAELVFYICLYYCRILPSCYVMKQQALWTPGQRSRSCKPCSTLPQAAPPSLWLTGSAQLLSVTRLSFWKE